MVNLSYPILSYPSMLMHLCLIIGHWLDTVLGRQAKLLACVFALENKLDTIRSAAPPYQLSDSDELKVCINIISFYSAPSLTPLIDQY